MHDDRVDPAHDGNDAGDDAGRDDLGALISAAGKRAAPPAEAYEQVLTAAHGAWRAKLRSRRRRWSYALAATIAAAAVAVAMLVGPFQRSSAPVIASAGIVQGDVRVQSPTDDAWRQLNRAAGPIVPGTRLRTTPNGRVALTLTGGVSLRVDAASEIALVSARELELMRGLAYVDSGRDGTAESFRIVTALGTIRDVGTQFEVAAVDDALRVRIREGAVRIETGAADPEVLGSAGEQLSLGADGAVERYPFSPFDPGWGWVETLAGTPAVEGRSLMDFLSWVARETGRELSFDAPATETRARTVTLHGNAAGLTPMRALEVMLSTTDFDYAIRRDGAILVSPRPR